MAEMPGQKKGKQMTTYSNISEIAKGDKIKTRPFYLETVRTYTVLDITTCNETLVFLKVAGQDKPVVLFQDDIAGIELVERTEVAA
jgi:hypothetical protein